MRTLIVLTFLIAGLSCPAAESSPTVSRFYIQLLRGSNELAPPTPGAKLVGAKVQKQLQPVFRWKNYWEIQRTSVTVVEGKTGRTALASGHSLEIDLRETDKRTVRLFRGKKLVRKVVCSRDKEFCIQGVEFGDGAAWFVVVRSDPPTT